MDHAPSQGPVGGVLDTIVELPSPEKSQPSSPVAGSRYLQSTLNMSGPSSPIPYDVNDGGQMAARGSSPLEIRDGTPREMLERLIGQRPMEPSPPLPVQLPVRSRPIEPQRSPPLPPGPHNVSRRLLPDGTALAGGVVARREEVERAVAAIPPASSFHAPQQMSTIPSMSTGSINDWLQGVPGSNDVAQGLQRLRGEYQTLVQQRRDTDVARAEEKLRATRVEENLREQNIKLTAELAKLKLTLKEQNVELAAAIGQASDETTLSNPSSPFGADRGSSTQLPHQGSIRTHQMTPVLEAMRMHDLLLHRQTMAVRTIQRAARRMPRGKRKKAAGATTGLRAVALEASRVANDTRARSVDAVRSKMASKQPGTKVAASPPKVVQSSSSEPGVGVLGRRDLVSRYAMPANAFLAGGRPRDSLGNPQATRLDRRVGSPCAAIFNAMEREHASELPFSSYSISATTPRAEWLYVVMQEVGSREDRSSDCTPERVGWRIDDFVHSDVARRAGLEREEVIAIRLHTGPMHEMYNAVLRAQRKDEYTTTIHAISSALVKLASQQKATSVYRVMCISTPPEKFFAPDDTGSCTGIEPGFMSTTANLQSAIRLLVEQKLNSVRVGSKNRDTVSRRSQSAERRPDEERLILFRIRVIPSDLAADVSFASQFPLEEEVLFTPVSCFDVVGSYEEEHPKATVIDLRPRQVLGHTMDQFMLKLKGSHLNMVEMMIDELRAAGAPEPALLPLSVLRAQHANREDNNLTAEQLVDDTSRAMKAHVHVLHELTLDATWLGEKGDRVNEISKRMLGVVALQARAGETDIVHEMMKLAFKRSLLSREQTDYVEDVEKYACAVTTGQSKAVIKPSAIKKLFPPYQHSSLECAVYFLSQGMVPPWPPLMASLLSKLTPASHLAFGEMVRQKMNAQKGANVLVYMAGSGGGPRWMSGLCTPNGAQVRLNQVHGKSQMVAIKPSLRILWPTDAGAGAMLNEAATRGDPALVKTLLNANVDLRYSDGFANSTLHRGVLSGDAEVCRHLIAAHADPLLPNTAGVTPWDLALQSSGTAMRRVFSPSTADIDLLGGPSPAGWVSEHMHEKELVRRLLQAALDGDDGAIYAVLEAAGSLKIIDTPNLLNVTALMFAARHPQGEEAVRLLLDCKASLTQRSRNMCTALMIAAEEGNLQSVRLLLDAGNATGHKVINKLDSRGYTALHMAVENGHDSVVEALVRAGADEKLPRKDQWTPWLSAAYAGSTHVLKYMNSANVNTPFSGSGAFAPIHLAAYNNFGGTLVELQQWGAQVNLPMGTGWSALMIAAARGHSNACEALISMKANVNLQSSHDGATALMAAVSNSHASNCLGLLLQAKANLHIRDARGVDALMLSARYGHAQAAQQLVLQRADPRATRHGATTALMDAAAGGYENIVRLLLSAGSEVGAVDDQGQSALFHAAKSGNELALLPLLQAGANVQRLDLNGQTAIAHAASKRVARRLLEAGASSTQLSHGLCVAVGIPSKEPASGSVIPKLGRGLSTKSAVSESARGKAGLKNANGKAGSTRMLGEEDKGPPLRAGEPDKRPLRSALLPLLLPPQVNDTAPLLKLFPENATSEQVGATFIVQNAYREMRWRRAKLKKRSFYQPKGLVLQMQAHLQNQVKGK